MYQLIAIGDPIIDTHVRIDDSSAECRIIPHGNIKLCFDYGSKVPIIDSFQSLGGNAPNVCVGATKLGLKTAVLSTVGKDVSGQIAIRELARYGVDTSLITIDPTAKTRYSIVLNYLKERTILSYSNKKNYAWPTPAPETEWIYYTGLGDGFETMHKHLMKYLTLHPTVRLAFNPGSYLMKFGRSYLAEIISRTDILIVNLEEAESLLNTKLAKEKSVRTIIHGLISRGAKEVAVTDAEKGAWVGNDEEVLHLNSFPVTVVAKTGAGDAFSAAYLAARFKGHDLKNALIWGITNSASVIQHEDCHTGLLDEAGIKNLTKNFPNIKPLAV
ncbi:MAG: carbohydrate kinase family protein [Patescibacteria group bacterium]|jgi:ribokinase